MNNSNLLDCFNWSFMIVAKIIRRSLLLILLNEINIDKWIVKVVDKSHCGAFAHMPT